MAHFPFLMLAGLFSLLTLAQCQGIGNVHARATNNSTTTGDSKCGTLMCVSATVNGSTVEYVLQSTGTKTLGWMAMGFGSMMANSPMIIMWSNSDGSITLSQRQASAAVMPMMAASPPRVATLSTLLSSTSGTQPKLAYTIAANSDTTQNIIWAFSTTVPGSADVNATLQKHIGAGTFQLDLTKTTATSNSSSSSSSSGTSGSSSSPFETYQKLVAAHAILCAVGFLAVLPAGSLLARYLRTTSTTWFKGHAILQAYIGGPIIIAGVVLGIKAVDKDGSPHLDDTHKKFGIGLFVLYFAQLSLGAIIHWIKPHNVRSRPLQNYLHAVVGLLLVALAFYQVRTGYRTEWPTQTGRGALPKTVDDIWYIWVVLLPVLYAAGLALLPRQFRQERTYKASQGSDPAQLHSTD